MDHLNDRARALALVDPFMKNIVAEFDQDWRMTTKDVEVAIRGVEHRLPGEPGL
jgi:hypothetical protein